MTFFLLVPLSNYIVTFPCRHRSAKHRNVCHSTKYMMLHVRDCSGLLSNGDVCPFPWCRKTKHLLYHLVSCKKKDDGTQCSICCPENLSSNLMDLVGLNAHRRKIFVERVAKAKAAIQSTLSQPILSAQVPVPLSASHPIRPPSTTTTTTTAITTTTTTNASSSNQGSTTAGNAIRHQTQGVTAAPIKTEAPLASN